MEAVEYANLNCCSSRADARTMANDDEGVSE